MAVVCDASPQETLKGKEALALRRANGWQEPSPVPESLELNKIELLPDVFQKRYADEWQSESHVVTLAAGIGREMHKGESIKMPPILIFWVGDGWVCIDGHHRIKAIQKSLGSSATVRVPVEVFQGDLSEAILESSRRNSRNKLPMSSRDKSEAAWRMVLMKTGSYKVIAEACGVSSKSIQRMVKAKKILEDRGVDVTSFRWVQVRWALNGNTDRDAMNPEEIKEGKIRRKAEMLSKAMGDSPKSILIQAIIQAVESRGDQRLLPELHISLGEHIHGPFYDAEHLSLPTFPEEEPEF